MSYNGSGVFLVNTSGQPVVANTLIDATVFNALTADLATGLSNAITKDGQQTITANIPMGGFKLTGLAAGSSAGHSLRYEQLIGVYLPLAGGTMTGNLLFTDATYDIGASGATRPRNIFVGGSVTLSTEAKEELHAVPLRDIAYYIQGLLPQVDITDPTNDIAIQPGVAVNENGGANYILRLGGTGLIKQSDVAWSVGTNQGMLDTGAIGNNDYYVFLIARPDTGVVDVLCSLSKTAMTLPANYTKWRLIGWFKRVAGATVAFVTYETAGGGLDYEWTVPTLDINLSNTLTTSRRTDAVKVPLNISVIAHLNVVVNDAATAANAWICNPDQTDAAPSGSAAPLANVTNGTTGNFSSTALHIRTSSTAGTIAARANIATVDLYAVSTMGFSWSRR